MKERFRFQGLEIWKKGIEIGEVLFSIADELENRRLFRFAEQLRGAGLSVSNNIAEGSGSISNKDFANFLNFARRSVFENANMIVVFSRKGLIPEEQAENLLVLLDKESQMITAFAKTLHRRQTLKLLCLGVFLTATLSFLLKVL
ncbi:MAG: four helix bundle protein [Lentisphaeria bacterium]|nr:four helix bundle protein [Lentisphaeria bacterium]